MSTACAAGPPAALGTAGAGVEPAQATSSFKKERILEVKIKTGESWIGRYHCRKQPQQATSRPRHSELRACLPCKMHILSHVHTVYAIVTLYLRVLL